MAKYRITHACGHDERHDLTGNSRSREWRAEQLAKESCAECQEELRNLANQRNAEANAAAGLPGLNGSEKQVAWAETIRHAILERITAAQSSPDSPFDACSRLHHALNEDPAATAPVLAELRRQDRAAWWIDNRHKDLFDLLSATAESLARHPVAANPGADAGLLEAAALAEATVRPTTEQTPSVAEIRVDQDRIEVIFPEKREDFRQLIRFELGYTWSTAATAWTRTIGPRQAPLADRVVEVAHRLLSAGFPVRLFDPALRDRAIAGDYQPERRQWISVLTQGDHRGQLFITWPKDADSDRLYRLARALPGAHWVNPGMAVPASRYDALLDFAEAQGFALTDAARVALDAARLAHDRALIATPAVVTHDTPDAPGSRPAATGAIDPALLDD